MKKHSSIIAIRNEQIGHESKLSYIYSNEIKNILLNEDNEKDSIILSSIVESTELCDGIGGITWDGALITNRLLESILVFTNNINNSKYNDVKKPISNLNLLELGCGSGICGIIISQLSNNMNIYLTDRCIDLAQLNIENNNKLLYNITINEYLNKNDNNMKEFLNDNQMKIKVLPLSWSEILPMSSFNNEDQIIEIQQEEKSRIILSNVKADIIIGIEICCLRKQHKGLVDTIAKQSHTNSIILLSFDSIPQPNGVNYEKEFIEYMENNGYIHSVVCTASVEWSTTTISNSSSSSSSSSSKLNIATITDLTHKYNNNLNDLSFPSLFNEDEINSDTSPVDEDNEGIHHIILFYRQDAIEKCKECNKKYFKLKSFNYCNICSKIDGKHVKM